MTDIANIDYYFPRSAAAAKPEQSRPYAGLPLRDRVMVDIFHIGGIALAAVLLVAAGS